MLNVKSNDDRQWWIQGVGGQDKGEEIWLLSNLYFSCVWKDRQVLFEAGTIFLSCTSSPAQSEALIPDDGC